MAHIINDTRNRYGQKQFEDIKSMNLASPDQQTGTKLYSQPQVLRKAKKKPRPKT